MPDLRARPARRVVTVALVLVTVIELAGLQPVWFGIKTYFGMDALAILLPLSFVFMVITGFHLYQTWPRVRAWFKKSPDRERQRDKIRRMVVLISFVVILTCDMAYAWYCALEYGLEGAPLATIRLWSWVATGLLCVHVQQRWRLTASYFKRTRMPRNGEE